MTNSSARPVSPEMALREDLDRVILTRCPAGSVIVDLSTMDGAPATIITSGTIKLQAPTLRETAGPQGVIHLDFNNSAHIVGGVRPDGWVVGPISPDTGERIAIEPEGALQGYRTWEEAEKHPARLRKQGHATARLPTPGELIAIYNDLVNAGCDWNAKIHIEYDAFCRYWSYQPSQNGKPPVKNQYGNRSQPFDRFVFARVRCVRDEPGSDLA